MGQSSKYKCWWTGPWTVSRIPNDLTYELTPHPSWPRQGKEVVSIDRLAEFYSDETEDEVRSRSRGRARARFARRASDLRKWKA